MKSIYPLMLLVALSSSESCGTNPEGESPTSAPTPTMVPIQSDDPVLFLSTNLVQMVTEEVSCPGSHMAYYEYMDSQGQGYIPSLQPTYVTTFAIREDWSQATNTLLPEIREAHMGVSLSLNWGCWENSSEYAEWVVQQLQQFKDSHVPYRLVLYQYGTTPDYLETGDPITSGWMNSGVVSAFGEYVGEVLEILTEANLTPQELVLSRELNALISTGCTSPDKQLPPGIGVDFANLDANTDCLDTGMEHALRALHAGLIEAEEYPEFTIVVDHNIRPDPDDSYLDYLYNDCWLSGTSGQWDFNCDFLVDVENGPSVDIQGITFYGGWSEQAIPVAWEDRGVIAIQYPDLQPDVELFIAALEQTSEFGLPVVVGEIGFSEADSQVAGADLQTYLEAGIDYDVGGVTLHGMHRHAEFTAGTFYFELYEEVERTQWGNAVYTIWSEFLAELEISP